MNAQIEGFLLELTSIVQDMPGVGAGLCEAQFNWSPAPGRWSLGQCIEHLNITADRYLPLLRSAIAGARAAGRLSSGPFSLNLIERLFLYSIEPPARIRVKAPAAFIAPPTLSPTATVQRWDQLQAALADTIRSADGIDLRAVKVRSQFGPVSFTLDGTFAILLAHERRHLWQAREVRKQAGFPAGQAAGG
ncbi:MAG: DinB family protein [Acidobacteria bacterium]|nr:DinB family protein [Acidobacteriota bacterium]